MNKRSIGKILIALLIATTIFFAGCSPMQAVEHVLETALTTAIKSAVVGNEDAVKVMEHMQNRVDVEILSCQPTQNGVDALCRVSSPDLTEFAENFNASDYETQEALVDAIIKAIDTAPVTEKEVKVGFKNEGGTYVPTGIEEFLNAYLGGGMELVPGL